MTDRPRIELSTAFVVAGTWRNLFVTEWRARASTEQLADIYRRQLALAGRTGTIVTLSVVPGSAVQPIGAEMRRTIEEATRDLEPKTRAAALALLAGGFGGAIIRSVLTSIGLVRRSAHPSKITATVEAAIGFVAGQVDGAPAPAEVAAIYREIVATPA
jgi:hypothetical protein